MRNTRRNRRSRPLEVEPLESMLLLSTLTPLHSAATAAPTALVMTTPVVVNLNGTTSGTYTSDQKNPDTGTQYNVTTVGSFAHYGPATVLGTLHSVGFIANGHATGTLRVFLPGGTLTLELTGPTQPGFSHLPSQFTYVITKGTGKFHNAAGDPIGRGTVDVTLRPIVHGANHGFGLITLKFHSTPVA
jgi:hypothetical protein